MDYKNLKNIEEKDRITLISIFTATLSTLKHISINKITLIIRNIPDICRLHHLSCENRKSKNSNKNKYHTVKPYRGEIYNAIITERIGSELSGNHLDIIMQNKKGNIFGEKVNILPIEGDGNKINPKYQIKLTNDDLESGSLDKELITASMIYIRMLP